MRIYLRLGIFAFALFWSATSSLSQSVQDTEFRGLLEAMTEIQKRSEVEALSAPTEFKAAATRIADLHRSEILLAAKSVDPKVRRLAAIFLSMATPDEVTLESLIQLSSDDSLDVRYAAIAAIPAVTDGTNEDANKAILLALSETSNPSLIRDASHAVGLLKIQEAVPLLANLLKSDEPLNKRYAAQSAKALGPLASPLAGELKNQMDGTEDQDLKEIIRSAITSIQQHTSIPDGEILPPPVSSNTTPKYTNPQAEANLNQEMQNTKNTVTPSKEIKLTRLWLIVPTLVVVLLCLYGWKKFN